MRKIKYFIYVSLISILTITGCERQTEHLIPLTILHWNDFHTQNVPFEIRTRDEITGEETTYIVGGAAYLYGLIDNIRSNEERVVVLNAGDEFQGTPISTITKGKSQIDLLNLILPDAMVLGNHEFDYGTDVLLSHLENARFTVLCANVVDETTGEPIVKPYEIIETDGLRVAVIGLITEDLEILVIAESLQGIQLLDPVEAAKKYIPVVKEYNPHLIIALTHMGVDADKILAQSVPDLDIIVGGHSHTALFSAITEGNTTIVQAGTRGRYLGRVDILVDTLQKSIYTFTSQLIEVQSDTIDPYPEAEQLVNRFEEKVDVSLSEVIGMLETDWSHARGRESNIGNWQADVMREFAQADIAFQNSGGIRKSLLAGEITIRDMMEINPFGNTFVTFTVNGRTLKNMLEWMLDGRGELMQVSGIKILYDSEQQYGNRIVEILINDEPLVEDETYSIVTNNYVSGHLDRLFGIDKDIQIKNLYVIDRDIFIDAIRKQKVISSEVEGRIINVREERVLDEMEIY